MNGKQERVWLAVSHRLNSFPIKFSSFSHCSAFTLAYCKAIDCLMQKKRRKKKKKKKKGLSNSYWLVIKILSQSEQFESLAFPLLPNYPSNEIPVTERL